MATRLVLVRHGQTEWTKSGRHTGRSDIPLTDFGREQAQALAEMLSPFEFEVVLTSPASRASETAKIAGYQAELEPDLWEWDYGVYEGITTAETRQEIPGWSVWTHEIIDGESVDELGQRCDNVISRVGDVAGDVGVFGHGHALRVLAARWLRLDPRVGANLVFATAAISVLGWERENPAILRWNELCHLRADEEGLRRASDSPFLWAVRDPYMP